MASGYVIAALLEASGLIGLALALIKIRAEREARAAELRSFLRSGQSASAPFDIGGSRRRIIIGIGGNAIPYAAEAGRSEPTCDSTARSALRRAIVPDNPQFQPARATPVSAG
ncbi:hypothetical protein MKK75_18460 [Methylobacterium sp. J-030]|uniref:hypothetical protein n=1 Tax=Methylobacterium sp. J-030 TaxID=2836627 RepID=UPI001FB8D42D|nr:hypothetical protein [Methylobacterium sp. J-030]MCJ2070749.1 hypothetical protein [Methylobacterium sp. J-030]